MPLDQFPSVDKTNAPEVSDFEAQTVSFGDARMTHRYKGELEDEEGGIGVRTFLTKEGPIETGCFFDADGEPNGSFPIENMDICLQSLRNQVEVTLVEQGI